MAGRAPKKNSPSRGNTERSGELFPTTLRYTNAEKLAIFRGLFRGRADVYPVRWESQQRGTSGYMPNCANKFAPLLCDIRKTKCSKCNNQAFRPLDDEAIARHLRGHLTIGVYGPFEAAFKPIPNDTAPYLTFLHLGPGASKAVEVVRTSLEDCEQPQEYVDRMLREVD